MPRKLKGVVQDFSKNQIQLSGRGKKMAINDYMRGVL